MKRKPKGTPVLVCANCGSDKVQTLCWVNANTNEYRSEGGGEIEDNWCEVCEEHVLLVSKNGLEKT